MPDEDVFPTPIGFLHYRALSDQPMWPVPCLRQPVGSSLDGPSCPGLETRQSFSVGAPWEAASGWPSTGCPPSISLFWKKGLLPNEGLHLSSSSSGNVWLSPPVHPAGSCSTNQLWWALFLTGESLTFWLGGSGSTSFSCTRKRHAPLPSSPGPLALPNGDSPAPLTRGQGPPHQGEESAALWRPPLCWPSATARL